MKKLYLLLILLSIYTVHCELDLGKMAEIMNDPASSHEDFANLLKDGSMVKKQKLLKMSIYPYIERMVN